MMEGKKKQWYTHVLYEKGRAIETWINMDRKHYVYDMDSMWEMLIKSNMKKRKEYLGKYFNWETRSFCDESPKKVFWCLAASTCKKDRLLKAMFSVEKTTRNETVVSEENADNIGNEGRETTVVKAMLRFERGDIITCLNVEEFVGHENNNLENDSLLYFGGTLFRDCHNIGKNSNACCISCGMIRATQRILPGDEIIVNYNLTRKHPVCFLDCFVASAQSGCGGLVLTDYGVIKHLETGKGNDEIYIVKFQDGKVEKLNQEELNSRILACPPSTNSVLLKRRRNSSATVEEKRVDKAKKNRKQKAMLV
jgi:hypothetical protein